MYFKQGQVNEQGPLRQIFDITFGYFLAKHSVKVGDVIESVEFQLNIIGGNIKNYVFDTYSVRLNLATVNNSRGKTITLDIVAFTSTISTQNAFTRNYDIYKKGIRYLYFDIKIYRS